MALVLDARAAVSGAIRVSMRALEQRGFFVQV